MFTTLAALIAWKTAPAALNAPDAGGFVLWFLLCCAYPMLGLAGLIGNILKIDEMMIEEIELKISGTKEEIEKHLLNQRFSVFFKRRTIANYYLPPNEEIGEHKTLKSRCVRLRTSFKIDEEIRKLGFRKLDLSESQDEKK